MGDMEFSATNAAKHAYYSFKGHLAGVAQRQCTVINELQQKLGRGDLTNEERRKAEAGLELTLQGQKKLEDVFRYSVLLGWGRSQGFADTNEQADMRSWREIRSESVPQWLIDEVVGRNKGDQEIGDIFGYAAVYGQETEIGGLYRERIRKGAFADVLKRMPIDTVCCMNHNNDKLLARASSGSLEMKDQSAGLYFIAHLADTSIGRDVYNQVKRGDLNGCSFCFCVGEDTWIPAYGGGLDIREIISIDQLFDVGPVCFPQYTQTSVYAARSEQAARLEQGKKAAERLEEIQARLKAAKK